MRIVITGSRDHRDSAQVEGVLAELSYQHGLSNLLVGVGDCPTGVDKYVLRWCNRTGAEHIVFRADWRREGRGAGPNRNRRMVDTVRPDRVLAFFWPGSANRGTSHCAFYAESKGIEVVRFTSLRA